MDAWICSEALLRSSLWVFSDEAIGLSYHGEGLA